VAACCLPGGSCEQSSVGGGDCAAQGGVYQGDGTSCATITCQLGDCCFPDAHCEVLLDAHCVAAGGTFVGGGAICSLDCSRGACCLPDGSCFFVPPETCDVLGGQYMGGGIACESVVCP
jgi:hypothetical protein